jgi:hypothetical protein
VKATASLVLVVTLALAGCGKVGPPQPLGPADQVIWPHGYPTPNPALLAPPPATPPQPMPAGTSLLPSAVMPTPIR